MGKVTIDEIKEIATDALFGTGELTITGDGVFMQGSGSPLGPYYVLKDHASMRKALKRITDLLAVMGSNG